MPSRRALLPGRHILSLISSFILPPSSFLPGAHPGLAPRRGMPGRLHRDPNCQRSRFYPNITPGERRFSKGYPKVVAMNRIRRDAYSSRRSYLIRFGLCRSSGTTGGVPLPHSRALRLRSRPHAGGSDSSSPSARGCYSRRPPLFVPLPNPVLPGGTLFNCKSFIYIELRQFSDQIVIVNGLELLSMNIAALTITPLIDDNLTCSEVTESSSTSIHGARPPARRFPLPAFRGERAGSSGG